MRQRDSEKTDSELNRSHGDALSPPTRYVEKVQLELSRRLRGAVNLEPDGEHDNAGYCCCSAGHSFLCPT